MSRSFAKVLSGLNNAILFPFSSRVKRKTRARFIENMRRDLTHTVKIPSGEIKILTHKGPFVAMAAEHFHTEEPDTLNWIDTYVKEGETFWDIGANIGMFSLYAAKKAKANVYAFEPFGLNYGILVEHTYINGMDKTLHPYAIALAEETKADVLHLRGFEAAGALNSVEEANNQFGAFDSVMAQATLMVKPEDACGMFGIPQPDHIKLDVDSIEVQIVRGLKPLLKNVKSILIEVEGENVEKDSAEIEQILKEAGIEELVEFREQGNPRNRLYVRK